MRLLTKLVILIFAILGVALYAHSPEVVDLFGFRTDGSLNVFGRGMSDALGGGAVMLGTISAFETRTMIAALEKFFPPKTFLLDTFFKNTEIFDSKYVQLDVYKGSRKIAPYVRRKAPGQVVGSEGFTTHTYEPPYVKPKDVLEPSKLANRLIGENPYSTSSPQQRQSEYIAKVMMKLDSMITRREEQQASEALFTGKIVLEEGDIDFGLDSTHNLTLSGSDLWSHADSDPYAQFETWSDLILKDSGYLPDVSILSKEAIAALLTNVKFKAKLDLLKLNIGTIDPKTFANGVKFYGTITGLGIDLWGYNETYLDTDGTTTKRMVPENKVLLASTQMRGTRLYGAIEHLQSLVGVKRFPYSWEEHDPSARFLQIHSAPLMNPVDIDAYLVADVL